ncbi:MAG: hypothetical protein ABJA81_02920 [Nocardioidaceae bacterium]
MVSPISNAAVEAAGPEIEKFASSSGRGLGWTGIAFGVALALGAALTETAANRGLLFGGLAVACLSWVTMVRPRASAHKRALLLRNMVRDTAIPWARIQRCAAHQTLQIRTDDKVYHGLGVTRSARTIMREDLGATPLTTGIASKLFRSTPPDPSGPSLAKQEQTGGTYTGYVESRISGFVASGDKTDMSQPVVALAVVPLVVLVVAAVCLVLAFL